MTRLVSVCGLIAAALAWAAPAHAEPLPNGAVISFNRLFITEGGDLVQPSTPDVLRQYLNLAHCACSQSMAGEETTLTYELTLSADSTTGRGADIWVGAQCDDDLLRPTQCKKVGTIADIDQLLNNPAQIEVSLYDLINATTAGACRVEQGTATLWLMVDTNGAAPYDYVVTQAVGQTLGMVGEVSTFDTRAPNLPTEFTASSAESAIRLGWTLPTAQPEDIFSYQAMCAKADGTPAVTSTLAPRYQTSRTLCSAEADLELTASTIDSDGTATAPPAAMAQLDPSFLCGETADPTATGILIKDLENDVAYTVALLVIDRYGNATGTYFTTTITPRPATDLWEDLHDRGSKVEGGFCLASASHTGGGMPPALGSLLLVGLALGYIGRGRQRRAGRALPAATALALIASLAPAPAHAQGLTPYWEDESTGDDAASNEIDWHVGLRFGPYVPGIDEQFGEDRGPYAEMFGGYKVLPMLDVDRIVWRGFGQLGIGGSIGYMSNTADAWADGSTPGDPDRMRSDGDTTTFGVLPLALTATYRMTYLDERFGIPIVPYVRAGLSYYIWWMRTNGETSSVCWDGTSTPGCDADDAMGATIGYQGSIGLAIRAERIDAAAAASMRASGIMHAGFFAELSMAKVDGFGSDVKLSVGDTTWFTGVDFEF